jgi:hypothetical protein
MTGTLKLARQFLGSTFGMQKLMFADPFTTSVCSSAAKLVTERAPRRVP